MKKTAVKDNPIPPIPRALLEWLERTFPNRAPSLKDTDREVWAASGAQQVIGKLRSEFNKQNTNNILKESE
jgi:hypothetical protein